MPRTIRLGELMLLHQVNDCFIKHLVYLMVTNIYFGIDMIGRNLDASST
jgi:hypothetical protein